MYSGKSIVIVGGDTLIGRIVLSKLVGIMNNPCRVTLLQRAQTDKKANAEVKPITRDPYYKLSVEKSQGQNNARVEIVYLEYSVGATELEVAGQIGTVDYVFNCYMPYEPFSLAKSLEKHVMWTSKLVSYLEKHQPQCTLIVLSSVYSQEPGYVTESLDLDQSTPSGFRELKQLESYLESVAKTDLERWRTSLLLMEQICLNSRIKGVHLVRTPVVGACSEKPQGYIDKFNGISFLLYEIGLGKVSELKGRHSNIVDVVPVDYVCNFLLSVGWFGNGDHQIWNFSASSMNPLRLGRLIEILQAYWNQNPPQPLKQRISVNIYEKESTYGIARLRSRIPRFLWSKSAELFDLKATKIEVAKQKIKQKRQEEIAEKYSYFLSNQWLCETNKCIDLNNRMTAQDRRQLHFNINYLDWQHYIKLYCFGIQRYVLGRNVEHYSSTNLDMLQSKGSHYFSDIYWALSVGKPFTSKTAVEMKRYVMSTPSVRIALRTLIEQRTNKLQKSPAAYTQTQQEFERIGEAMCDRMFSEYNMKTIRLFAWFMHKVFKQIYEQVVIDKQAILKLKSYEDRNDGPIVLMPTHRSYIDFIILSYIFFGYGIKCPHIAAAEDFLNMAIIHVLLRKSGAFFIKRDQQENRVLYKAIMAEYVTKLLVDKSHLEFFVEGTRSRVGKMLEPKYGMLSMVIDAVMTKKIPNAYLVPITINYEKVLQGATFPLELLGESKVKESLGRLLKAVDTLKENYGRIYIQICHPIELKKYMEEGISRKKQPKQLINSLGYQIVHTLSDNLVVMPPAIVASIVLMQRRGISEQELNNYVEWFCKEVHSRGIKIARTQETSSISVTNALGFLDDVVTKTKKNIFELDLSMNEATINIFLLSYYRNTITHIFFLEAIVLTSLYSFGYEEASVKGVPIEQLKLEAQFLYKLLCKEYVLKDSLANSETLDRYVDTLAIKNVIIREGNSIRSNERKSIYYTFLCSLIWPLVESYWLTSLYLFNLEKLKTSIPMTKLVGQVQWFGEEMIQERVIEHYEAVSQDTVKNAINAFSKMGIIQIFKEQVQEVTVQSVKLNVQLTVLKQTQTHISNFLKSKFAKGVKGLVDPSRSSVMLDFPFLAKL